MREVVQELLGFVALVCICIYYCCCSVGFLLCRGLGLCKVVIGVWSLGSFAVQSGIGWCFLAQEIISVIHYLPCFRECLFTHLLSVFTAFPVFLY
jgi:hypothetical protein